MMKLQVAHLAAACALSLAPGAFAAESDLVPDRLLHARYVALGIETGDDFLSETEAMTDSRLMTEDLQALRAMRKLIERWDRYAITERPGQAELLIAIRVGQRTVVGGGVTFGPREGGRSRKSVHAGVDVSFLEDMLTVYQADEGRRGPILWRSRQADGLSKSSPRLFEELKAAVEKAAPKTP